MEDSSEKSKSKQYRDSQKDDFYEYPPVEKYMGPSSDLKHIEISRSPRPPHSDEPGNDR